MKTKNKSYLKKWENNPNNEYIVGEDENNLRSREVAKKYIYDKNRDKYPKPWGFYVVHHINGKTLNDTPENLYICIRKQHNLIHQEQINNGKKFANSSEIDIFLNSRGNTKLFIYNKEEYKQNIPNKEKNIRE